MKNILTFAGRIHHYQKLSPIVNELRARGHRVEYLVSDNATNNDPSVEYLIEKNEPFVHALDFLEADGVKLASEMVYGSLRGIGSTAVSFSGDIYAYCSPFWVAFSLREECEFIVATRRLLSQAKPDCVLILHENNHWGKMLAYLCQESGIPSVVHQEGQLRHRDQATQGKQSKSCEYADLLLVWSESARQAYLAAGIPPEKVKTIGLPHLDNWFVAQKDPNWNNGRLAYRQALGFDAGRPLVTFALPQMHRYDGSPKRAIGAICDWSAEKHYPLALRFHPFEDKSSVKQVEKAIASHPCAKVITEGDTIALMVASDLVISQHSTVATEALALGVPLAEIDWDNVGVLESLVPAGVAHSIAYGELGKIPDIVSGKTRLNYVHIEKWLQDNVGARDGRSAWRAANEIEGVMR